MQFILVGVFLLWSVIAEAAAQRYAVIDIATGNVVNIVLWDGITPWSPGTGYSIRLAVSQDMVVSPQTSPFQPLPVPSLTRDNSWTGKQTWTRSNLIPSGVDPTFLMNTVGKGDNSTYRGVSSFYFSVNDDASVTASSKGALYGGQISVRPLVSRDNTPFDDAAAIVAQNASPNKSMATDAIYVGHNGDFDRNSIELEWVTSFLTDANSDAAYRGSGAFNYGFDLCFSTGCAVIGKAPIRAPLMAPASSSAPCSVGAFMWDGNAVYACVSQNHWRRSLLSDF